MPERKVTGWYPPEIKPVRVGWYACQQCTITRSWRNRHYWDGRQWLHNGLMGEQLQIVFSWRGLPAPPKRTALAKERK